MVTPYDITNAKFLGNTLDISSQETSPGNIVFSNDGLKLFLIGSDSDSVHEYTLTIPFILSTATFSGNSFDVSNEDTGAIGVVFSNDGLKMFMLGFTNDFMFEYNLITAFDITSATYSGNSFDFTNEDSTPRDIKFSNDGMKLFMIGSGNDSIYEYDLATAFTITTMSYSGTSFSINSQETSPRGITFSNDGMKLFMTGNVSDSIHEYNLITAFSLATIFFTGISLSVVKEDTGSRGVEFSSDGFRM